MDEKEDAAAQGAVDGEFQSSLGAWITRLLDIDYKTGIPRPLLVTIVVSLINKFIFVQTLDDLAIIGHGAIQAAWMHVAKEGASRSKKWRLDRVLHLVDARLSGVSGTGIFRPVQDGASFIECIDDTTLATFEKAHDAVKDILGINHAAGERKGILQFNFAEINEGIIGQAYEAILPRARAGSNGTARKEHGIFYTPGYISRYIVRSSLGERLGCLVSSISTILAQERVGEHERAAVLALLARFTSLSVLDPACGCGAFLAAAFKALWDAYRAVVASIASFKEAHFTPGRDPAPGNAGWDDPAHEALHAELLDIIGVKRAAGCQAGSAVARDLVPRILVRHLFGNDLDGTAVEIAKAGLWLHAVRMLAGNHGRDAARVEVPWLPDLAHNLTSGDSLWGLGLDATLSFLVAKHENDIVSILHHREQMLHNPSCQENADEMAILKENARRALVAELSREAGVPIPPSMSPVFWGLEFCFQFIEAQTRRGAGRAPLVVKQGGGFTFVVGNPPYFLESREHKDAFSLYAKSPLVSKYYESKMDIFYFFIELGLDLLEPDGVLGYIIMEYWNTRAKTRKLQARIMADSVLEKLIKFHEFKVFGSAKGQHNDIVIIRKLPAGTSTCKEYPLVVINVVGKDIPGSHVNDLLNEDSLKRLLETTPVPVFFRWDEGIKLVFSLDKSTWFEACRFSTSFGSLLPAPFIAELQHQARSLQDNDLIRRNRLVVVNDIANHEISIMEPLIRLLAEKIGAAGTTSIPAASMTNGLQTYVDRLTRGLLPKIPLAKRRAMRIEENDGIFVLSIEECGKMALSGREMALMKNFYHADQVDSFFIDITNPRKLIYSPKNYITRDRHDLNELARELAGTMDGCPGGEPGTGHLRGQGRGSVPVPFIEAAEARLVKETCEMFPAITSHLLKFQDVITSDRKPFGIHRSREPRFFEGTTRIVSVRKTTYPKFVLVEGTECFMDEGVNVILCDGLPCNPKALVAFLNSMLVFFWIKHVKEARHGDVLQVDLHVIASIPLVDAVVNSVELARLHDVIVKGMKCMKCMKSGATGNQVDEIGGCLVARDEARAIHDATCQVHDARARVDAAVFKGYGLDKTDVLNVMHALNVPAAVQRDIICHLEKME